MSDETAVNLDAQLRRVQLLLAKADSTDSEAEASALRAEAERRMKKYRIDESSAAQRGELKLTPVTREFSVCRVGSDFKETYLNMAFSAIYHVGARAVYSCKTIDDVPQWYVRVTGFESDVRIAESIYTAARTYFASRMEPQIDPSLSDAENIYALRSAGIERSRIGMLMGWGGEGTNGPQRVTRVYKAECLRRGVDPTVTGRQFSRKIFREAFEDSFQSEFSSRLYRSRNAAAGDYTGGAVVLANRSSQVDEAFYAQNPGLRPSTDIAPAQELTDKEKAAQARLNAKILKDWMEKQARMNSESGRAGISSGAAAAAEVELDDANKKRLS